METHAQSITTHGTSDSSKIQCSPVDVFFVRSILTCGSDGALKVHSANDFDADAIQEHTPENSDTIHAFALSNQVTTDPLKKHCR